MKIDKTLFAALLAGGLALPAIADSGQNFSTTLGDSAEASARLTASGIQVATGAVAIPITIAGIGLRETGELTANLGDAMSEAANAPLVVDDTVVVAQDAPTVPRIRDTDGRGQ